MVTKSEWERELARDRERKTREHGKDPRESGAMPDSYYTRQIVHGEFSRSGLATYRPQSSDERRRELISTNKPNTYVPPRSRDTRPEVGMICTGYVPNSPAVRRAAMIVCISENGKELWVFDEFGTRATLFVKNASNREYIEHVLGDKSRLASRRWLAIGVDDATWSDMKQWRSQSHTERSRFPSDIACYSHLAGKKGTASSRTSRKATEKKEPDEADWWEKRVEAHKYSKY